MSDFYEEDFLDPLQSAFENDPDAFVANVVGEVVAQAAGAIQQNVAAQVEGRQAEIDNALSGYALDQADRAMRAAYGEEWEQLGDEVAKHLESNPHLLPTSRDPQHIADALEAQF